MLDEYVNDLKERLQTRRDVFTKTVIDGGDPVARGKVQALDLAIGDVDELFLSYCKPDEDEAPPLTVSRTARGELAVSGDKVRRFGMRRAS